MRIGRVPRSGRRIGAGWCAVVVLLLTSCRGANQRVVGTVKGPVNVPDFTAYAYTASGCKDPTWTVSDPVGTIASGQNSPRVGIEWGEGPKQVDVSAACGSDTGSLRVKVMQVTITNSTITTGAFEDAGEDATYHFARLGDGDGAPPGGKPGITFGATITVAGPTAKSSDGPNKITSGFVQTLRTIPKWEGAYAGGDKQLLGKYDTQPPWHDQVRGESDPATAWYTNHAGANFTPSAGKLTSPIKTWDSPKPGWPRRNDQGKPLLEATATWQFDTYI